MKIRIGIFKHSIQIRTDRGVIAGRKVQLCYGRGDWIGAGYIGGFTLYAALNCLHPQFRHLPRKAVQLGFTRNGNRVPYTSN